MDIDRINMPSVFQSSIIGPALAMHELYKAGQVNGAEWDAIIEATESDKGLGYNNYDPRSYSYQLLQMTRQFRNKNLTGEKLMLSADEQKTMELLMGGTYAEAQKAAVEAYNNGAVDENGHRLTTGQLLSRELRQRGH